MSRIFWDTNLFAYFIEGKGERAEQVAAGGVNLPARWSRTIVPIYSPCSRPHARR